MLEFERKRKVLKASIHDRFLTISFGVEGSFVRFTSQCPIQIPNQYSDISNVTDFEIMNLNMAIIKEFVHINEFDLI
jgi:hypothetical protein